MVGEHQGLSNDGNSDLFEVTFAPGEKTYIQSHTRCTANDNGSGMSNFNNFDPLQQVLYDNIKNSRSPEQVSTGLK